MSLLPSLEASSNLNNQLSRVLSDLFQGVRKVEDKHLKLTLVKLVGDLATIHSKNIELQKSSFAEYAAILEKAVIKQKR